MAAHRYRLPTMRRRFPKELRHANYQAHYRSRGYRRHFNVGNRMHDYLSKRLEWLRGESVERRLRAHAADIRLQCQAVRKRRLLRQQARYRNMRHRRRNYNLLRKVSIMNTCKHDGCDAEAKITGYCRRHYQLDWLSRQSVCSEVGCNHRARSKGLCESHYKKQLPGYYKNKVRQDAVRPQPVGVDHPAWKEFVYRWKPPPVDMRGVVMRHGMPLYELQARGLAVRL